ncbi:MAG: radical SAM protein [Candidatus Zixiibacteriota bacterium]
MKASRYNHLCAIRNGRIILAYNSYSGAVAEIESENYPVVRKILDAPNAVYEGEAASFLQCLRDGGFLIPDGIDQRSALRVKARSDRLEGTILTLTIAPTLACNFSCDYCFESRTGGRMSEPTQEALLAFVDRYLYRADGLRICWFGGEPTLCLPIIERLQREFAELTRKHRLTLYPGMIITNGYLLDAAMARQLKELGVAQAQVTLDGPRSVHDSRRKLKNGRGTFDRILDNLCAVAGILKINIRINIDKDNVDSAYEVVELLQSRQVLDKVNITFAPITPSGSVCSDIIERCHDNEEFAGALTRTYRRLLERGIRQVTFPRPSSGAACGAIAEGYFVVSPTGHLFKCWEDLSLDGAKWVGDIFSSQPSEQQLANLRAYQSWQPLGLTECRDCSVLPICMGGCPARGLEKPSATCGSCVTWKHNLGELLDLAYASANASPSNPNRGS